MIHEEKQFCLRFSLEAEFSEDYEGEDDNYVWLRDWDQRIKPDLLKIVFESLRRHPSWTVHVRNRGVSPQDEIEIAMTRNLASSPSRLN